MNFNIHNPLYKKIAYILVVVGGILWGLAGLFNVYILTSMFGMLIGRLIYIVVGVAGGYLAYLYYLENFKKTPPAV